MNCSVSLIRIWLTNSLSLRNFCALNPASHVPFGEHPNISLTLFNHEFKIWPRIVLLKLGLFPTLQNFLFYFRISNFSKSHLKSEIEFLSFLIKFENFVNFVIITNFNFFLVANIIFVGNSILVFFIIKTLKLIVLPQEPKHLIVNVTCLLRIFFKFICIECFFNV
jgi:hypothetical protein